MKQQVNLYRPASGVDTGTPNTLHLLIACAVTAVLMLALYAFQWAQIQQLDKQIAALNTQSEDLQDAAEDFDPNAAKQQIAATEQHIASLQSGLASLRAAHSVLANQSGTPVNQQGFSNQVEALARQHISGISLSGIHILKGGSQVSLSGTTYPAEKAPRYITALQSDAAFSEANFGQLRLRRDRENGQIEFSLHHQDEAAEESP